MSRDDYAREVLRAGRDLGITPRGIVIGYAVVFVECDWIMYANAKVPESLTLPHERVGSDGKSVGLFQQQVIRGLDGTWWWGDAAACMDPYVSARMFFKALARLDYNSRARSPGWYAQAVQRSAFPDRYDQRMREAQALYDRITSQMPDQQKRGEMATAPQFREMDMMGNSRGVRSQPPRYFLLHTEEGNSDAEGLARYCNITANEVSYHYTLRNRILVDVVDTDYYSWSVLDANVYTINLCFAGSRASWSRQQWIDNAGADIEIAAWIARQDCAKYGIDQIVYGPDAYAALARAREGISDHRFVTKGLGIGTHTDVGDGFPWDLFRAHLDRFNGNNQEDDMAFTDDDRRKLNEVWDQLRGPDGKGWQQLGGLTPVDALAKLLGAVTTISGVLGRIATKLGA